MAAENGKDILMKEITRITAADLKTVREIAYKTWPSAYGEILSKEQIQYMLDRFYNDNHLLNRMDTGSEFYVITLKGQASGFIELKTHPDNRLKIEKIYILPDQQGHQLGQLLITFATQKAAEYNTSSLFLNVNRYNKAIRFYEKQGFSIAGEEDIDIGSGYLMEDYIMIKPIDLLPSVKRDVS